MSEVVLLELLSGSVSSLDVVTVAVLSSWPDTAVTSTWMVAVTLAPEARDPTSNVTVPFWPCPGPAHEPWLVVQSMKTVPVGRGSAIATARAVPGPPFRTTIE